MKALSVPGHPCYTLFPKSERKTDQPRKKERGETVPEEITICSIVSKIGSHIIMTFSFPLAHLGEELTPRTFDLQTKHFTKPAR